MPRKKRERIAAETHIELMDECLREYGYALVDTARQSVDPWKLARRIGRLVPQGNRGLVHSICADSRYAGRYHSLSSGEILPHTECFEQPGRPPRYIGLCCVKPPEEDGGDTLLADARSFFQSLSPTEQGFLMTRPVDFISYSGKGDARTQHTLFERTEEGELIHRFSAKGLAPGCDPEITDLAENLLHFFDEEHIVVRWKRGVLLIFDNHRMLHARRAFQNMDRELHRVWIEPV